MPTKVHLLVHTDFLGDKNQALGIKSQLLRQLTSIEAYEWNDQLPEQLVLLNTTIETESSYQHILIAIGSHGLTALKAINCFASQLLVVYASHQVPKNLSDHLAYIDILALPEHVINESLVTILAQYSRPQLLFTCGVAHNLDAASLQIALKNWQEEAKTPIQPHQQYIGVILGGDAPEADGTMRYFTAEESKKLAYFLKQLNEHNPQTTLLITNSPRTGQYDPIAHQKLITHTGESLDATTASLLQALDNYHIPYQFFDFISGQKSAYVPILATLFQNPRNIGVITLDSTSMVTEMLDVLPENPLYVVHISSMNESHKAHGRSIENAENTYVTYLDQPLHSVAPTGASRSQRITAAQKIADGIFQHLKDAPPIDGCSSGINSNSSTNTPLTNQQIITNNFEELSLKTFKPPLK